MQNQKNYVCPVCNGFEIINQPCPACNTSLADYGPISYLYANYSPYRPIDDLKKTDGFFDVSTHQCPHLLFCETCTYQVIWMVQEIKKVPPSAEL
jgi:hypothetical protein